jgi:hypothetical protein
MNLVTSIRPGLQVQQRAGSCSPSIVRIILICLCAALALEAGDARAESSLFSADSVLEIKLTLNFRDLCRPREEENCDFVPTTLGYRTAGQEIQTIPVEIKIRGGWRSLAKNCSAPLLWVRFKDESSAGTPFEGHALLPLTTHCGKGLSLESINAPGGRSTWEQYLLKEYLGYRFYALFTSMSVRARLVSITYPNPDNSGRAIENYAFFTEHFESVAARNGAKLPPRGIFDHKRLDTGAADILALFHFMIGNTDWSIVRERNVVLMLTPGGEQVPVPFDLDMSGLVNTHYAGPAPGLPIDNVRRRYYLGFCHPDPDWDSLFELFLGQKETILSMIAEVPGLNSKSIRSTKRFLNGFFETIESGEHRDKDIVQSCLPWPPSADDHTSPIRSR